MKNIIYICAILCMTIQLQAQEIITGEYFIDIEPGLGLGIPLAIGLQADSVEQDFAIALDNLSPGFHYLGIRFKNDLENWSALDMRSFFVHTMQQPDNNIISGEYFVDVEPGLGNGTAFVVASSADSLEYDVSLLLPAMDLGNHILYIRYKNADNNWTLAEPRPFVVCTNYAAIADFSYNVTDDLAFFSDNSQYVDSLVWDFGDGSPATPQRNPTHLYATGGQYTVTQLCYNVCGNDTITKLVDVNGAGTFSPGVSANTNYVVATITGAGFQEGILAKLIRNGEEIIPTSIQWNGNHHMTVTFNFVNETLGNWDLAIEVPGVFTDTLIGAITLEPVEPFNVSTYIVAPARQLINRYQKVLVNITNDGNQTVFGLQNFVKFSKENVSVNLLSDLKAPSYSDHYLDSINHGLVTALDPLTQDSVYSGHYIIPMLGPGETTTLMFSVFATSVQPMSMQSVLGNSIFSPSQVNTLLSGITSFTPQNITGIAGRIGLATNGILPNTAITGLAAALIGGTNGGTNYNTPSVPGPNLTTGQGNGTNGGNPPGGCVGCGNQGSSNNNGGAGPISGTQQVGAAIVFPIIPNAPINPIQPFVPTPEDEESAQDIAEAITDLIWEQIQEMKGDDVGDEEEDVDEEEEDLDSPTGSDCGPDVPGTECFPQVPVDFDEDGEPDNGGDEEDEDDLNFVSGFDPNAIYGPDGFTDEHYIRPNQRMHYTVTFENVDTASANVVEVRVNTFLDTTKFDMSTFRYEAFGIGEQIYALAPYRDNFVSEVDQSGFEDCLLRVTGNQPDSVGNLHILFESLNLETRALIDNPDDGFLPPNVDAPFGEAYFIFSVMQKENQIHLTEFPMEAEIIFDLNEPIFTEIYNNIIDLEAPASSIDNIDTTAEEPTQVLHFNKEDSHSGIDFVDLYVSENGGAYDRRVRTNSDSLLVVLAYDVEYRFYTIATDFCGNEELAPENPDVTVTYTVGINETAMGASIKIYPVPSTDQLTCEVKLDQNASVKIEFENMLGERVEVGGSKKQFWQQSAGVFSRSFSIDHLASGVYNLKLTLGDHIIYRKFIKQ